jgi:hypothetical protein
MYEYLKEIYLDEIAKFEKDPAQYNKTFQEYFSFADKKLLDNSKQWVNFSLALAIKLFASTSNDDISRGITLRSLMYAFLAICGQQ